GLPAVRTCIRLDPRAPELAVRLNWMTLGLYFSRKYEAAIEAAKRGIRSHPDFPSTYRWLAAALGQIGQTVEAKEALEKAVAVAPASFEIFVGSAGRADRGLDGSRRRAGGSRASGVADGRSVDPR